MPDRSSTAVWEGSIMEGTGTMTIGHGAWTGPYSFKSRFEDGKGTNPEELIAAAHAGCYSMQLSGVLGKAGHTPDSVRTTAVISLDKDDDGFTITRSDLTTEVAISGLEDEEFQKHADEAKQGCPVSRALGAIEIGLEAKLA